MDKEKIQKILDMSCREKEGMERLRKAVCNLPPLRKLKGKEVPLEMVEKAIKVMMKKYGIGTQGINICLTDQEELFYTCSMKNDMTYDWLGNVYGRSMEELLMKIAIKMYFEVKTNEDIYTREEVNERRKEIRGIQ